MFGNSTQKLRQRARVLPRFCRARNGATAVEFALIAPFFLATLLAVFQTCIFLFAQAALQNAAIEAARLFLTGQAQSQNLSATQVVQQVCPTALFNCGNMYIVVQSAASSSSLSTAAPGMYNNGQAISQAGYSYDPGTPGEIMVVQLVYAWPVIGVFGFTPANLPNGATEMMGVSAFRVEPYQQQ
jgi:Flp pilus assembly protein TadG